METGCGMNMAETAWIVQEYAKFKHLQSNDKGSIAMYVDSQKAIGLLELPKDAFVDAEEKDDAPVFVKAFACIDFAQKKFAFALLGLQEGEVER